MNISFYGLQAYSEHFRQEIKEISDRVLLSGQFFDEASISGFETKLAAKTQRKFAVSVASCTDALFFSLSALGIAPGDRVIVPAVSFIASVTPVIRAGAVPVFADIDPSTGLMNQEHTLSLIKRYPIKAIIAVDLYGSMISPAFIRELETNHGIPVICDAAQSLGSVREGSPAGSCGMIACFSFDPTKVFHAFGAGGAVLTNDASLALAISRLRYHGKAGDDHPEPGYNSRLSALQAELLSMQLEQWNLILEQRNSIAAAYQESLKSSGVATALDDPNEKHNRHKFPILCQDRERIRQQLNACGIQTMIHYAAPLYHYSLFNQADLVAEHIDAAPAFCNKVLSIPLHTFMPQDEIDYVCEALSSLK